MTLLCAQTQCLGSLVGLFSSSKGRMYCHQLFRHSLPFQIVLPASRTWFSELFISGCASRTWFSELFISGCDSILFTPSYRAVRLILLSHFQASPYLHWAGIRPPCGVHAGSGLVTFLSGAKQLAKQHRRPAIKSKALVRSGRSCEGFACCLPPGGHGWTCKRGGREDSFSGFHEYHTLCRFDCFSHL